MTLIIGMLARDGIVVASESQMTFATVGQHLRGHSQKVRVVEDSIAYGISTDHGSIGQLIDERLVEHHDYGNLSGQSVKHLRNALSERVQSVLAQQTKVTVSIVGQPVPPTAVIFGCYAKGTPHLFEISPNGLCTDHAETGFTAVGSGDIFTYHAMSTFRSLNASQLPLAQAKVLVYRIIYDAVQVAATGIGGSVQMACVTPDGQGGKANLLTTQEIDQLDYQVGIWRKLEGDALTEVGLGDLGKQAD